jgi:hypothetical protein
MGIERRLEKLEAGVPSAEWVIPIEVRVYCKALERYQARNDRRDSPPYSQEEIEELRRQDIETVEGQGFTAELHDSPGWQSEEGRKMLAEWREGTPAEDWRERHSWATSGGEPMTASSRGRV